MMKEEDERMFLEALSGIPLVQSVLRLKMPKTFKFYTFKDILASLVERGYASQGLKMWKHKGALVFCVTQKGTEYLAKLKGGERK